MAESQNEDVTQYSSYDSPLTAYPLLRSRLEGTSWSCPSSIPDLHPLRQAVLQRVLTQLTAHDRGVRVCQYEVPGGGVCRDEGCDGLHLSRLTTSEPSGTWSVCPGG